MKLVFPDEVGRGHVTEVVLDDGDEMVSLAGLEVSVLSVQLNSKGIFLCVKSRNAKRSSSLDFNHSLDCPREF